MSAIELIEKSNSKLKKALENYHSVQNQDTLKAVISALVSSRLLVPGTQTDKEATFSIIKNPKGEPFFLAFTDREELKKFTEKEYLVLPLKQMALVLQQNPTIKGFVINVKGNGSFILPSSLADRIIASYAMADLARE